jgi:outer membrane PBP1 activator LpoA protein
MKNWFITSLIGLAAILAGCKTPYTSSLPASEIQANLPQSNTQHIALLLPLTGQHAKQAEAVQAGFLSAYYQQRQRGAKQVAIDVVDTHGKSIQQAYQEAIKQGANLVVGPLLKEEVKKLEHTHRLSVPVIALNTPDTHAKRQHDNFFKFSLSPEEEATQVAEHALAQGYQRALVITPDGTWGKGIKNSFTRQWQSQGGEVADSLLINNKLNLSEAIKNLLQFKQVDNEDLEEEARRQRREDFDMIFLVAPPALARQIYPLLRFYNAENVPVFATSLVYSGAPSRSDRDLNGIYFADMPILFDQRTTQPKAEQKRLQAFGQDAFLLSQQLNQLLYGNSLSGQTGRLFIDPSLHVRRQLTWAQFKNGEPKTQ